MLYHGNRAETFIALFYEQAGLQDNSYFTECKIILIVAENGHDCNFGVPKRSETKIAIGVAAYWAGRTAALPIFSKKEAIFVQ